MVSKPGPNGAIELELEAEVATLRFSNPDRRNCVSVDFAEDLMELTRYLDENTGEFSVIALVHDGPVFCSGYDLDVVGDPDSSDERSYLMERFRAGRAWLANIDRPVVIGAKGPAVAAGAGLVAECDIAVVGHEFRIWWPEINVGVFPLTMGPGYIHRFGAHRAAELTFLGDEARLSPDEARELGLINRIVDGDEVEPTVRNMAETMAGYERDYGYMIEAYEVFNLSRREYDQLEGAGRSVAAWKSTYDQWYGSGSLVDRDSGMPAGRGGDTRE